MNFLSKNSMSMFAAGSAGSRAALTTALATVAMLTASGVANAQDWTFGPTVTLSATQNDNIRLANDSALENSAAGGEIDALLRIARTSPRGSITVRPRVRATQFPDDPLEESTDVFLDFNAKHNSQTTRWSFLARYSDEEVLSAEIEDPDFDNPDVDRPITDDSGRVQVQNTRTRFDVSPAVEFDISDRSSIGIAATYIDTGYDNNINDLNDYTNAELEAAWNFQATERNRFSWALFAANYELDADDFSADSYGITGTLSRQFSPRMSGFIMAGFEQTESESFNGTVRQSDSGGSSLLGLGLRRTFETSRLVVDLRRSVDPTGDGNLVERNQFRTRYRRQLSPLLNADVNLRYQQTNSIDEFVGARERDVLRLRMSLNWQMTRTWSLTGSYSYTWQEYSDRPGDAASNQFRVGVRYSPPRRN